MRYGFKLLCSIFLICTIFFIDQVNGSDKVEDKSYSEIVKNFKEAIKAKDRENIKHNFSEILSVINNTKNTDKRYEHVHKVIEFLAKNKNGVIEYIYPEFLSLINTMKYGKENTREALLLIRKHGVLKYIKINRRRGKYNERGVQFYCYYNDPLNEIIENICSEYKDGKKSSDASIRKFIGVCQTAFQEERTLFLPEKTRKNLIKIYYLSSSNGFRSSIVQCLIMSSNLQEAYDLLVLLEDDNNKKQLIKRIPKEYRGKNDDIFKDDENEEK